MTPSHDNLKSFAKFLEDAPTDEKAEKFVREMLSAVAGNCPMELLVKMGQLVIEFRKQEMKDFAEGN